MKTSKHSLAFVWLAVAALPVSAWAQTTSGPGVTLTTGQAQPILYESDRSTQVTRDSTLNIPIGTYSYDDCSKDRVIKYQINQTNPSTTRPLSIWASQNQDCKDTTIRSGTAQLCWKATNDAITPQTPTDVYLRLQDIAHVNTGLGRPEYSPGTVRDCDGLNSINFSLDFLYLAGDALDGTPANTSITFDTVGSAPPSGVTIGVGEKIVNVSWDLPPAVSDIARYAVYCDDGSSEQLEDGGASSSSTSSSSGGSNSASSSASSSSGGSSGFSSSGDTIGDVDGASSGASSSSSSSSSGDVGADPSENSACPATTAFRANAVPLSTWKVCKFITGGTSHSAKVTTYGLEDKAQALVNGQKYAFAVSAYDNLGNPGPLSEVVCDTPIPTDDFLDLYNAAGGEAAGCSTTGSTLAGALPGVALGAFALALARGFHTRRRTKRDRTR